MTATHDDIARRLLEDALSMDPSAVAKWLIYTSDGTDVALRSGRGYGWRRWRRSKWMNARGAVSHLLACPERAHPALMRRARERFCAAAQNRAWADEHVHAGKEFARSVKKIDRLLSLAGMRAVVRAAKALCTFDEPPGGPVDALAQLRARVAA